MSGLDNMVLNPWHETEAQVLWVQTLLALPQTKPLLLWGGETPLSGRWFSQGETHHWQFGCADPCDFHRCKANECR